MPSALLRLTALSAAGLALAGCVTNKASISPDYGLAVRENLVAQIANPDAVYSGDPAPASNGARTALAQKRYEQNAVIQPQSPSTTQKASGGGGGGGGAPQ